MSPECNKAALVTSEALTQGCSQDVLVCGQGFPMFNMMDDFNRELLAQKLS